MLPSQLYRGRTEYKVLDGVYQQPNNIAIPLNTTTTNVVTANLCRPGTEIYQRNGRRINMMSMHLKGVITQTGTVTTINDYARLAVVYDRQTNQTLPTHNDIFEDQNGNTTASTPGSGVKIANLDRFKILADIKLALPAVSATGIDGSTDPTTSTFNINRYIPLRGLVTEYAVGSGSTPNIGDVTSGGVYVVGFGSLATGSEGWKFVGTWRLKFSDP